MATVHIPMKELPARSEDLLACVPASGEILVDAPDGRVYRIMSTPRLRTAAEILADPTIKWSGVVPDEDFANDLEEIIKERKLDLGRDPWAE